MKKLTTFIFLVSVFGLTACGGNSNPFGDSDPLKEKSYDIQHGVPPKGPQPPDEKPIGKDIFVIDGEGFAEHVILQQNEEREVVLTARSFFDKSQYRMEITNLKSFKNATVEYTDGNTATGQTATAKFKWTPSAKDVFDEVTVYKLDLLVYTTNLKNFYSYNKTFTLFVYREEYSAPEILNIQKLTDPLLEGKVAYFNVDVRDKDGLETPVEGRPKLMILPNFAGGTYNVNASPFIDGNVTASKDSKDPTLWHFQVKVDLSKAELTDKEISGNFYIAARSRFDKVSVPVGGSFTVWTAMTKPATTWTKPVTFKAGANNSYTFTVSDPKAEGVVGVQMTTDCATALPGATCSCEDAVNGSNVVESVKVCTVQWHVPDDATGTFSVGYSATNLSKNKNDTQNVSNTFLGQILIEAK